SVLHDGRRRKHKQCVCVSEALRPDETFARRSSSGSEADERAGGRDQQRTENEKSSEGRGHRQSLSPSVDLIRRLSSFSSTGCPLAGARYSLLCETIRRSLLK